MLAFGPLNVNVPLQEPSDATHPRHEHPLCYVQLFPRNCFATHPRYWATWKADGTRYMALILKQGTYLMDRSFNVVRCEMRFPNGEGLRNFCYRCSMSAPPQCVKHASHGAPHDLALLDGEMVLERDPFAPTNATDTTPSFVTTDMPRQPPLSSQAPICFQILATVPDPSLFMAPPRVPGVKRPPPDKKGTYPVGGPHDLTLLDGEMVLDHDPEGRQPPRLRYLIYDCCMINSTPIIEKKWIVSPF